YPLKENRTSDPSSQWITSPSPRSIDRRRGLHDSTQPYCGALQYLLPVLVDVIVRAPGQASAVALQTTLPFVTIVIFKSKESSMHMPFDPRSFKPAMTVRRVSA